MQEAFFCSLTFWLYLDKMNGEEKYFSKFSEGILSLRSSVFIWTSGDFLTFTDVTKGGGANPYLEYGREYTLIWVHPSTLGFWGD
jgi:hypothetical protein